MPVRKLDGLVLRKRVLLHLARLEREQRAPQVALADMRDLHAQGWWQLEALLLADLVEDGDDLRMGGGGDAQAHAPRADRRDHL